MAGRDRRGDAAPLFSSTRDKFSSTYNVNPQPDCLVSLQTRLSLSAHPLHVCSLAHLLSTR